MAYGPDAHLKVLEDMSVDQFVNRTSWNRLLQKLTDEWREFTLFVRLSFLPNVQKIRLIEVQATVNAFRRLHCRLVLTFLFV